MKLESIQDLADRVGEEICNSDWLLITQQRIEMFANATNDRQWIHVDVERAEREAPGGLTIAHGYLTLSLVAGFADEAMEIGGIKQVINYGLNKVRFVSPVVVGSRLRGRFVLSEFTQVNESTTQLIWRVTIEIENNERPACVADVIFRYYT